MKNDDAPGVAAPDQKKLTLNNSISYNLSFSPKENNWSVSHILFNQSLFKERDL